MKFFFHALLREVVRLRHAAVLINLKLLRTPNGAQSTVCQVRNGPPKIYQRPD